jgi:hypothetical protein
MARRMPEYKKRLYIALSFWILFLVLCKIAWDSGRFSGWGPPLMALGLYELWVVPTRCRARTTRNGLCKHPCYGLLKGCRHQASHGPGKRADWSAPAKLEAGSLGSQPARDVIPRDRWNASSYSDGGMFPQ